MTRSFRPASAVAVLAALGAAATLATAPARAADGPPPVQAFFSPDEVSDVQLSPDGRHFAMLVRVSNGHRRLVVGATANPTQVKTIVADAARDVVDAQWVNDGRLVFSSWDEDGTLYDQHPGGLYVIDRDGSNFRQLVDNAYGVSSETSTRVKDRTLPGNHWLLRTLRDGSNDIIVGRTIYRREAVYDGYWVSRTEGLGVLRLDTTTQIATPVVPGEFVSQHPTWLIDDHGKARMVEVVNGDQRRVFMPPPEGAKPDAPWRLVHEGPRYVAGPGGFHPAIAGPDGRTYVMRRVGDNEGLFRVDADGKPEERPLVDIKGFDYAGGLVFDRSKGRLLGVRYRADAPGTAWLDPTMAAVQAKVDALLPGLVNTVSPADCGCSTIHLVRASSDRQPDVFLLYDAAANTLSRIGDRRSAIVAKQMGMTDFERFKARDGLEIPAYVTRPAGKGPWPTVVLVHGGPWVRGGGWTWDDERQFLASRGYLVVEPEFRGSTGYGDALYRAGFRQWGRTMQDDLVDATKWAAAKGWADGGKVCLMGGSYGGYATLMGVIRDPEVFRCGVAFAAPTDLVGMYDIWWSDFSDDWKSAGLPVMLGDKQKDAEALRANSPALLAEQLRRPVLLGHGMLDSRVPPAHADRFRQAARKAGGDWVTWVSYAKEGHGFSSPESRYDWYTRVETFLGEQLKR